MEFSLNVFITALQKAVSAHSSSGFLFFNQKLKHPETQVLKVLGGFTAIFIGRNNSIPLPVAHTSRRGFYSGINSRT